jgi:hypothetical protein
MLAAWLRISYAAIFAIAIGQLVGVLRLVGDGAVGTDRSDTEVMLKVDAFHDIWNVSLVLFGAHLLLIGYLAYRSGVIPKFIGILLLVAGLGYLVDSFGAILIATYSFQVSTITFLGELLLMIWLLARGNRVRQLLPVD